MKLPAQIPEQAFIVKKHLDTLDWAVYMFLYNDRIDVQPEHIQKFFNEDILASLIRLETLGLITKEFQIIDDFNIRTFSLKRQPVIADSPGDKPAPITIPQNGFKWQTHLVKVAMPDGARQVSFEIAKILKHNLAKPYTYIDDMKDWVNVCKKISDIIEGDLDILYKAKKELDGLGFSYTSARSFLKTVSAIKLKQNKNPVKRNSPNLS